MKSSDFVTKNRFVTDEINTILDEYYKFYLENGRLPSSYSKDKEERRIYSSYYRILYNIFNLYLTTDQIKKMNLIRSIKEKQQRYNDLLCMKKLVENGSEKELYEFLLFVDDKLNNDALLRAFKVNVENSLSDKQKQELIRIDNLRRKVNYLALEIRMFIEENDLSPSSIYCKKCYIRSFDGKVMTMKCAYAFVREYVNYIDDDLLEKLNNCHRIKKKLVKTEI